MLNTKYIILFFTVLLHLPGLANGQSVDLSNRKPEIEKITQNIYFAKEFLKIADSLQMSANELSDYPIIFPVKNPTISSGYGMRRHPVYKVRKFHSGIDFAEIKGTPVYATGNGIVVRKGYSSGYGNFIEVEHAGGFRSFYAHLSKMLVNKGDTVSIAGQIACVGNTGMATGYHLHYEVRKDKRFLNPTQWCYCLLEIIKSK